MKKISLLIISMLVSIVASAAVGDVFVTGNYRYQITAEATGTDATGPARVTSQTSTPTLWMSIQTAETPR